MILLAASAVAVGQTSETGKDILVIPFSSSHLH